MSVQIDDSFFILGNPIETNLGKCHFIKVKDYPNYFMDLHIVSLTKEHIIQRFSSMSKDERVIKFIEEMRKSSLFDIVREVLDVRESYIRLFDKLFEGEGVFHEIKKEKEFEEYRQVVLRMSCIKEEEINPNPEIQKAIDRSKRVKAQNSGKFEFVDMVTSIVGFNGLTYKHINEFTVYQLYMTYYRIAQIKNYDTSTLFATVAADKVDIENWSKHIDMFEEEKHFVTQGEFNKTVRKTVE